MPVMQPPTNTSSPTTGASRRTTDSKRARFASATQQAPKPYGEFAFGVLALADPSVAEGIDQS
jgi:hypothetical protein